MKESEATKLKAHMVSNLDVEIALIDLTKIWA